MPGAAKTAGCSKVPCANQLQGHCERCRVDLRLSLRRPPPKGKELMLDHICHPELMSPESIAATLQKSRDLLETLRRIPDDTERMEAVSAMEAQGRINGLQVLSTSKELPNRWKETIFEMANMATRALNDWY